MQICTETLLAGLIWVYSALKNLFLKEGLASLTKFWMSMLLELPLNNGLPDLESDRKMKSGSSSEGREESSAFSLCRR